MGSWRATLDRIFEAKPLDWIQGRMRKRAGGRMGHPQGCPGHPQVCAFGAQSGSPRQRACPLDLDTARHRIDLLVGCTAQRLACPSCGALDQPIDDRNPRSWRHLDFFQFEAWLHAGGPRVGCTACGKTRQIAVPWARDGSGFTLLFEALALTMCQGLPVRQAARMLRVRDKQLWRRIEHYVTQASHGRGAQRRMDDRQPAPAR